MIPWPWLLLAASISAGFGYICGALMAIGKRLDDEDER